MTTAHPWGLAQAATVLLLSCLLALTATWSVAHAPTATVGGTRVPPDLHCEQDQAIGFYDGVLSCLPIEKGSTQSPTNPTDPR